MLTQLHIENVALIKKLDIELSEGFTVFTGETGAGKSIIIDSIRLLSGARADREMIREGTDKAFVSGVFSDFDDITLERLSRLDVYPDDDGLIFISRSVDRSGKNKIMLGARSIPLSLLKDIGDILIAIHGQYDSMALLSPESHIGYLDSFSGNDGLLSEYAGVFGAMTDCKNRLREYAGKLHECQLGIPSLRQGMKEIEEACIKDNEEKELDEKRKKLRAAAKIGKNLAVIEKMLNGDENALGAVSLVKIAENALSKIQSGESGSALLSRLCAVSAELQNIGFDITSEYGEYDDKSEEVLLRIEQRLGVIDNLVKKYGDLTEFRKKAKDTFAYAEESATVCERCKNELMSLSEKAFTIAERLTESRKKHAGELEESVKKELAFLDLPNIRFDVSIREKRLPDGKIKLSPNGSDDVEFLISPNVGEGLKPLIKIASGGEASRIMLALRTVFADRYSIPSMIFDEIDTGISGKTSEKIGMKMHNIVTGNKKTQVFSVTHSAQVASCCDTHLKIEKHTNEDEGRTETVVRQLSYEERIDELARIMGGINISENVRASAKEMIDKNST